MIYPVAIPSAHPPQTVQPRRSFASASGTAFNLVFSAPVIFSWATLLAGVACTLCSVTTTLGVDPSPLPNPRTVTATVRDDGWTGSLPGIEPNPHKTFNPDSARASNRSFEGLKTSSAKPFSLLQPFRGSRQLSPPSYPVSDFLPKSAPDSAKSFPSPTFSTSAKSALPPSTSFNTSNSAYLPSATGVSSNPQSSLRFQPPASQNSARDFQGQEADRMNLVFPPGGAPNSGVTQGRRLSVEDVKNILNKTK